MRPITKRQIRIAGGYSALGLVLLSIALWLAEPPSWGIWAVFAGAFVALELKAVEVNDRLMLSSGMMVLLTAGTLFALQPGASALAAMALMAALGPLVPADLRQRRWFQPLANLGQMVVAAFVAGALLDRFLGGITDLTPATLVRVALAGSAASLVYTIIQLAMVRFAVKTVYGPRNLLPWSGTHILFSSQVVMGLLGGLLGAALQIVGKPAVMALILGVYVIAHLSLSSYSQLREAHQSAIRGFVKALEARDLYTRGHTERVAYFAQLIGEELKLTGTQLEKLRWAALIHDLGKLAIPGEMVGKRGQLTADEVAEMAGYARRVERILSEVDFLRPMVRIAGTHYARAQDSVAAVDLDASILAVADAFEAMTATRSYRMPLSQAAAFTELREGGDPRFHTDAVDALERALARTGEVYGGPAVDQPVAGFGSPVHA